MITVRQRLKQWDNTTTSALAKKLVPRYQIRILIEVIRSERWKICGEVTSKRKDTKLKKCWCVSGGKVAKR